MRLWSVLAAPPSWLTGHVLRRDCVLAPIPAADYARHHEELVLVPDVGISSASEVGSVLLFGHRPFEDMTSIAVPTDSASSVALLRWLVNEHDLDVEYIQMGPDLDAMLEVADGALVIGDRALDGASSIHIWCRWTSVRLGLSGLAAMVFGVFVARADTPGALVRAAHEALLNRLVSFETNPVPVVPFWNELTSTLGCRWNDLTDILERCSTVLLPKVGIERLP